MIFPVDALEQPSYKRFMTYSFTKMHGLGNDFVILEGRTTPVSLTSEHVRRLTDRRLGIGCDQLIVLEPSQRPGCSVFLRIFNRDGSEVEACGNATRCVGQLLALETGQPEQRLETVAGVLTTSYQGDQISTNMGHPQVTAQEIGLAEEVETLFLPVEVRDGGKMLDPPVGVGVGNPHMVFFVTDSEQIALDRYGAALSHHPLYPRGTNVEFVSCLGPRHIRMRVWERGTGITLACATGACASVVAGVRRGLLAMKDPVRVTLDGGDLMVTYEEEAGLRMSGPVKLVCQGSLAKDFFQ